MEGKMNVTVNRESKELVLDRIFNAPREIVFRAFTEKELITKWFSPKGWNTTVYEMNVKPGGVYRYCMESESGQLSCGKTLYSVVQAPEKLVYTDAFADKDGKILDTMPTLFCTVLFEEVDGKTKVTSTTRLPTVEELDTLVSMGVEKGVGESWDRLEDLVSKPL